VKDFNDFVTFINQTNFEDEVAKKTAAAVDLYFPNGFDTNTDNISYTTALINIMSNVSFDISVTLLETYHVWLSEHQ
jgi:hypothetical protein